MSKHTPRPWTVTKTAMGETAIVYTEPGYDGRHICTLPMLSTYSPIGVEYKSNASLIASAPDMHQLLSEIAILNLDIPSVRDSIIQQATDILKAIDNR